MKYCSEQGCRQLIDKGRYCDKHRRKKRNVGASNKPFYSTQAWRDLKADCYQRDKGRCTRCNKFVFGKKAQHHHIIPINVRPDLKLDPGNVTTLCPTCHMIVEHETKPKPKHNFKW